MGLMAGFLGGLGKGVADSAKMYLDNEFEALKAERIAEAQSKIKLRDDLTLRERNVADAATERARVDTEAKAMADKRSAGLAESARGAYRGLMAADQSGAEAGLKAVADAEKSGAYQQEPTTRDRMMASGQYDKLATLEAADAARSDTRSDREADNARADKELALRQKQEARLSGLAASESKLKEIQIGQAVEVEAQRKRMMDKSLTDAQRTEAKELYQVLSGKDADKYEIIKTKDDLGREVVLGRQNTKTGQFEKFNGDGFVAVEKGATAEKTRTEAMAHVRAGNISLVEANKRLASAGIPPIQDVGDDTLNPARFTKKAPIETRKNPITLEPMTKAQWDKTFGKGDWDKTQGEY